MTNSKLQQALQRFAQQETILIASDFDGTLAPFVERPEDARMSAQTAETLKKLSSFDDTYVALVSGRNIDSLKLAALPEKEYYLIGSHGAEMSFSHAAPLTTTQRKLLLDVCHELEEASLKLPGTHVEYKPAGVVFHYRNIEPEHETAVAPIMNNISIEFPQVHMMAGKKVFEFAILNRHKGQGIQLVRDYLDVDAVFFAGDDVTDENGFKVLDQQDVGVKVGQGSTQAAFRVKDISEVSQVLSQLATLREQALSR